MTSFYRDWESMGKKTLVREHDKFMLRLPDGMRERIKAKADRAGMSMNEAIVYCLESWFPAPKTLEQKIDELALMVAGLKQGKDLEAKVDAIVDELDTTLREVASGILPAGTNFRKEVRDYLARWDEERAEIAASDSYNPFDDANYPANPFPDPPTST